MANAFADPGMLIPIVVAAVVILSIVVISRMKRSKEEEDYAARKLEATSRSATAVPSEPTSAAAAGGKKKKRRSTKKKSSGKSESEREVESETETEKEAEPVPVKASKPAAKKVAAAPVVATTVTTTEDESDESSSDEEEEVISPKIVKRATQTAAAPAKKNVVTATAAQKAQAEEVAPVPTIVSSQHDGWAIVEDKKFKAKVQKKQEAALAAASAAAAAAAAAAITSAKTKEVIEVFEEEPVSPPAPVIETISKEMKVDAKKIGLLIGPKGATKTGIQDATATNIEMPKTSKEQPATGTVTITVTGSELGVQKAAQAINELLTKGYCGLLAPEDFQESYVAVHPKYLKDVIGKNGAIIKALTSHTGVKITIPDNIKGPGLDGKVPKIKIGLTGLREKVSLARMLIKDLTKYHHTTVTHPGLVHCELDIPSNYFNVIIGAKGSEIKNIQNSHKVSVYIPDADSANENVVVVGETANVIAAQQHIESLIVRADERAAQAAANAAANAAPVPKAPAVQESEAAAAPAKIGEHVIGATVGGGPGWNSNPNLARKPKVAEEAEEEWVKEFAPNSSLSINITSILGENTKFAPVSVQPATSATGVAGVTMPTPSDKIPAPSSAWNNLSSAWNN